MTPFSAPVTDLSDPALPSSVPVAPARPEAAPPGDAVASLPCRPRRRRRRIDRHEVGRLLAMGHPVSAVADKLGCHRQHIWRLMRKSHRVRHAVAVAENEVGVEAAGRLAALRPTILNEVMRQMYDDRGVLLWAAKASGLAEGGSYMPPLKTVQVLPPETIREMKRLREEVEQLNTELDGYRKIEAAEWEAKWDQESDEKDDVS